MTKRMKNKMVMVMCSLLLALVVLTGCGSSDKVIEAEAYSDKLNNATSEIITPITEKLAETETETVKKTEQETETQTEIETETENIIDDYILSESNIKELTEDDIKNLSEKEKQTAINEIYARHERMFNDENIQEYFNSKNWYTASIKPEDFIDEDLLNKIEKNNIQLLAGEQETESSSKSSFPDISGTYRAGSGNVRVEITQTGNNVYYIFYDDYNYMEDEGTTALFSDEYADVCFTAADMGWNCVIDGDVLYTYNVSGAGVGWTYYKE